MKTDTIAAIATAVSDSGIGIIRVSGEEAVKIVAQVYQNVHHEKVLDRYDSHTIHYGFEWGCDRRGDGFSYESPEKLYYGRYGRD